MTVEYVLLLVLFVGLLGSLVKLPMKTFDSHGPRLGARIEKHLMTGDGFDDNGKAKLKWQEP
jgi:hypothetical protein